MSVIIENMDMPSFCLFCPFNFLDYCVAASDKYISELKDKSLLEAARMSRPAWCPLKRVKESEDKVILCKDCMYYNGGTDGYGVCTRDLVKDTDYCSRGKGRDDEEQ